MSHIHMCAKCFAAYECRQPHMGAEPSECDWCRDGITDDLVKATNEQNDPTEPTAEARATVLARDAVESIFADGTVEIPEQLIVRALLAFAQERVEQAEKRVADNLDKRWRAEVEQAEKERDQRAADYSFLRQQWDEQYTRIASLEAELARVREERDEALHRLGKPSLIAAGMDEKGYPKFLQTYALELRVADGDIQNARLRARLSPERLEKIADLCDHVVWHSGSPPQTRDRILAVLQRELSK